MTACVGRAAYPGGPIIRWDIVDHVGADVGSRRGASQPEGQSRTMDPQAGLQRPPSADEILHARLEAAARLHPSPATTVRRAAGAGLAAQQASGRSAAPTQSAAAARVARDAAARASAQATATEITRLRQHLAELLAEYAAVGPRERAEQAAQMDSERLGGADAWQQQGNRARAAQRHQAFQQQLYDLSARIQGVIMRLRVLGYDGTVDVDAYARAHP